MKLRLHQVRLPLASFDLALNVECAQPVTGVFGPSGAGKTTLLELIAGLRKPKSALIQLDDIILTDTARHHFTPPRARGIGYVPQDGALFPHFSVRTNLLYGTKQGAQQALGFEHVVEVLEIEALLDRRIGDLSGGEK